jgi:uncharacterized membrane protein YGL010W
MNFRVTDQSSKLLAEYSADHQNPFNRRMHSICVPLIDYAGGLAAPLWLTALVLFVAGWIGQFIGHYVEGRRPSFFRDLRFLLNGPLWVLQKFYALIGIRA